MRTTPAGLCDSCRWKRVVPSPRSTFVLCTRGLTDALYAKYPVLPVTACRGYDAEARGADRPDEALRKPPTG